jgi:hypothetical protein
MPKDKKMPFGFLSKKRRNTHLTPMDILFFFTQNEQIITHTIKIDAVCDIIIGSMACQ